jgi:transposase
VLFRNVRERTAELATRPERTDPALGVEVDPAAPYAPHEKGKVKRLNRTIAESFIATLPGYTDGPRDQRGRLETAAAAMALAELVVRFAAWVQTST